MKRFRAIAVFLLGSLLVLGIAAAAAVDSRYPWFYTYLCDRFLPRHEKSVAGPVHVMFIFVDHFEPHGQATMDRWMSGYPALAGRHRDSDGTKPQHSFFWFFAESDDAEKRSFLRQLSNLSFDGYGEVELHLHHWDDTEKTFLSKIGRMIDLSREAGAFVTAEEKPQTVFGFIHGLWALDNSRQGACGVNNEILLLKQVGCYADFTHPSWGKMTPRTVNRLYYVTDDPEKPKSYDFGAEMRVGGRPEGDLLIFEGPTTVRRKGMLPRYDHGDVAMDDIPTERRVADWIKTGIHVKGRPEWVFVKVFTHGALIKDHEAVLGEWAERMYTELEKRYNDGSRYVLHYVTAREAYNIAKAAEAGKKGNPNDYRDFLIPPYLTRYFTASVPFEVFNGSPERIVVRFLAGPGTHATIRLRGSDVSISGVSVNQMSSLEGVTTAVLDLKGSDTAEFLVKP